MEEVHGIIFRVDFLVAIHFLSDDEIDLLTKKLEVRIGKDDNKFNTKMFNKKDEVDILDDLTEYDEKSYNADTSLLQQTFIDVNLVTMILT